MRHVDALSRIHMYKKVNNNQQTKEMTGCTVGILNESQIEHNITIAQEQDSKLKNIKQILVTSTFPNFMLLDGILFRKDNGKNLLVVPKNMIDNILRICHDNRGHIGIEKTIVEIKKNFWFSSMRKYVKKHIKNCLSCIFYNPVGKKGRIFENSGKREYSVQYNTFRSLWAYKNPA